MAKKPVSVFRVPAPPTESLLIRLGHGWLRSRLRKDEASFFALLIGDSGTLPESLGATDGKGLRRHLESKPPRTLILFKDGHEKEIVESLPAIAEIGRRSPRFLLLIPQHSSPPAKRKPGRVISAIACDPGFFLGLAEAATDKLGAVPFHASIAAIEETDPEFNFLARQFPVRLESSAPVPAFSLRVIIPHRGDLYHIRNCLRRTLFAVQGLNASIHVALDEDPSPDHANLAAEFPTVHFWRVTPCGGGPYVPRHLLGLAATEDFVAFQDSDDVPTADRFRALLRHAAEERGDVVGSHVLDVHEDVHRVKAMRYPLDAVTPLMTKPQNTVFHPTTIVRTTALHKSGGFSTAHRMACDREFNLRSYLLGCNLRNTDEFLYIRRMRSDSLIHSPETGMRSEARKQLHTVWHRDYRRIMAAELALPDSSIAPKHLHPLPQLIPISALAREHAARRTPGTDRVSTAELGPGHSI